MPGATIFSRAGGLWIPVANAEAILILFVLHSQGRVAWARGPLLSSPSHTDARESTQSTQPTETYQPEQPVSAWLGRRWQPRGPERQPDAQETKAESIWRSPARLDNSPTRAVDRPRRRLRGSKRVCFRLYFHAEAEGKNQANPR